MRDKALKRLKSALQGDIQNNFTLEDIAEYRSADFANFSLLKELCGETPPDPDVVSKGSFIDTYLTSSHLLKDLFVGVKDMPGGKLYSILKWLSERNEGKLSELPISEIEDAITTWEYYGNRKMATIVADILKYEEQYNALEEAKGKTAISDQKWEEWTRIALGVVRHPESMKLWSGETLFQVILCDGFRKGMADFIKIDRDNRTLTLVDIKSTDLKPVKWIHEVFYRKYPEQLWHYWEILTVMLAELDEEWEIEMKWLVVPTGFRPFVVDLDKSTRLYAAKGFKNNPGLEYMYRLYEGWDRSVKPSDWLAHLLSKEGAVYNENLITRLHG